MAKLRRNQKLVCVPCGREITVNACGASRTTLWCCGRPMKQKAKAATRRKTTRRKTTRKKRTTRRKKTSRR